MRIVCAVLFTTFSFLYISLFQGELLALVQDYLAQGQTSNNTFITATIITLLLLALQFFLNRVGQLHGRFEAFSYLPSCVLLALLTKVDNALSYSWVAWVVSLVIVAVIYMLVVWLRKNTFEPRETTFLHQCTPNLGVLAVLFVFTGCYGNDVTIKHMELSAWEHAHGEKYDKVLKVGNKSDDTNADLTALRNLALAKTGQLGNMLFAYPQPYGSEGLLMHHTATQTPSYGVDEYYHLLGQTPDEGESATDFYHRMMQVDSVAYGDLYLSALLLDKNLELFVEHTVDAESSQVLSAAAPKHHQEAWIIFNEQHPFTPVVFTPDNDIMHRYQEYLALYETYSGTPVVMKNLCKRQFGDTYWYYYDFVK